MPLHTNDLKMVIQLGGSPTVKYCGASMRDDNVNASLDRDGPKERKKRKTMSEWQRERELKRAAENERTEKQRNSRKARLFNRHDCISPATTPEQGSHDKLQTEKLHIKLSQGSAFTLVSPILNQSLSVPSRINSRMSPSAMKRRNLSGSKQCQRKDSRKKKDIEDKDPRKKKDVKERAPRKKKASPVIDPPPLMFNPATFSLFSNASPVPYHPPDVYTNNTPSVQEPENASHDDVFEQKIYFSSGDSPFDVMFLSFEEHQPTFADFLIWSEDPTADLGTWGLEEDEAQIYPV